MNRVKIRAALALWRRRVTFRTHRLAVWQNRLNKARAANVHPRQSIRDHRDHWHHLLANARDRVTDLERQLATPTAARGVDISNNNGTVDWRRIRGAGFTVAWLKASEGQAFNDGFFPGNVKGALGAGLKVGAYHFLRHGNPTSEARHFVRQVRAAGLNKGDLLPVVDVEAAGVTMIDVERFINEVDALLGVKPMIYTFPSFAHWTTTFGCKLWIANFGVRRPTIPGPWKRYTVWQHSSTAIVPGVSGHCDVNKIPSVEAVTWR